MTSYYEQGRLQEIVPFWQSHLNISLNDERGIRTGLNINKEDGEGVTGAQVQSTRIRLLKIFLTKSLFSFNGCQLCRGIRSPQKGKGEDVLSKLQIQVYCLVIFFEVLANKDSGFHPTEVVDLLQGSISNPAFCGSNKPVIEMFHGALAALRQKGRIIFQGSRVTPLLTLTQCIMEQRIKSHASSVLSV